MGVEEKEEGFSWADAEERGAGGQVQDVSMMMQEVAKFHQGGDHLGLGHAVAAACSHTSLCASGSWELGEVGRGGGFSGSNAAPGMAMRELPRKGVRLTLFWRATNEYGMPCWLSRSFGRRWEGSGVTGVDVVYQWVGGMCSEC